MIRIKLDKVNDKAHDKVWGTSAIADRPLATHDSQLTTRDSQLATRYFPPVAGLGEAGIVRDHRSWLQARTLATRDSLLATVIGQSTGHLPSLTDYVGSFVDGFAWVTTCTQGTGRRERVKGGRKLWAQEMVDIVIGIEKREPGNECPETKRSHD